MKAVVIESFGHEDQLKLTDLPVPIPGPTEVLIEIAYTSVNPVDWKIRKGFLQGRLPHRFPIVLGWDAAGRVKAVGRRVKRFKIGDSVFAYCRKPVIQWGTYAEYIALEEDLVALMPSSLGFAQAASIPLAGLTAWQALHDRVNLQSGEIVLVHAGAGGVGSMGIEFARALGAEVITTTSPENEEYVRSLGANQAIDYRHENFVESVKKLHPDGIDVVLDCVGGETYRRSFEVLKPGGRIVSTIEQPDAQLTARYGVEASYHFVVPSGAELTVIGKLIDAGKVSAPEIHELPLEQIAEAHMRSEEGHVRGKIVLKIK
jgi:NADPH:quinone reductase-like Zn-dependent oxidoreductase